MVVVISWGVAASSESTAAWNSDLTRLRQYVFTHLHTSSDWMSGWGGISQRLQGVWRNALHRDARWGKAYIKHAFLLCFLLPKVWFKEGDHLFVLGVTLSCLYVNLDDMVYSQQMVPLRCFPVLDMYPDFKDYTQCHPVQMQNCLFVLFACKVVAKNHFHTGPIFFKVESAVPLQSPARLSQ